MNGREALSDRLLALFVLGMLLLNAPFLIVFDKADMVFGIPVLYVYLFAVWAGLIMCVAWVTHFHAMPDPGGPDNPNGSGPADIENGATARDRDGQTVGARNGDTESG